MLRRRPLVLLMAAVLLAGPGSVPVEAKSAPGQGGMLPVAAGIELNVLSFNDELCLYDEMPIIASVVSVVVYADGRGKSEEVRRNTGRVEQIRATVADPSVASVTPEVNATMGRGRPAEFTITANRVGTTTITYQDVGFGQAGDVTETIVVKDCAYQLTMVSVFKPNLGFTPTLLAAIVNLQLNQPPDGGDATTVGMVSHSGTAPPIGQCVVTYEVVRSKVEAMLHKVEGVPTLFARLRFEPFVPSVHPCHFYTADGIFKQSGTPQPLSFTIDMRKRRLVITLTHQIVGNAGTFTGPTTLILKKVAP